MRVQSYLQDAWVDGSGDGRAVHNAVTGDEIARVSTTGLDLAGALAHARRVGGANLRALSFAERGAMLKKLAQVVVDHRDALIDLSRENYGATRRDAKFDIDGASGTLSYYAYVAKGLGDATILVDDDDAEGLMGSKRFVGQHLLLPRRGVAVHINAFNFPTWGMAEKMAVSLLAGVPVFTKPATATTTVAAALARLWLEAGILPEGSFSFLAGSVGDLLDHVGPQDCIAFTGSGAVGAAVRSHPAVVAANARVNIEADSLNASILGPDIAPGDDTWHMWVNDVLRDFTQKAGQKCTSVRRIFVPADLLEPATEALTERLQAGVIGDPSDRLTDWGPLAHPGQKRDYEAGLAKLSEHCELVWKGDAPSAGCYAPAALFRADDGLDNEFVHDHEVFGPTATVLPWDGSADALIDLVARGGGGLVASLYSNDVDWTRDVILGIAPWNGRILWGSKKVSDQSPGPGTVLPNFVHGGPGKAGGGEELGGRRGLTFYLQRTALQAEKGMLKRLLKKKTATL